MSAAFTPNELESIIRMCDHERTLIGISASVVRGLKTAGAYAEIAVIAAKADEMLEAMANKPAEKVN